MPDRRISVSVFVRNAGAVLLIHYRGDDAWLPIRGELELCETPLEAALRELRTQAGLHGQFPAGLGVKGTPPGFLGYEEYVTGSKESRMGFSFMCDVDGRDLSRCTDWDEARWVTRDELGAPGSFWKIDLLSNVGELVRLAMAVPEPEDPVKRIDDFLRWYEAGAYTKLELTTNYLIEILAEHRARREELWRRLPGWAREPIEQMAVEFEEGDSYGPLRSGDVVVPTANVLELKRWFRERRGS